ncbi:ADP-ribosylglycohydrolase family protein [Bacillus mangrovi]|uniref:ADP-ribosylglycohydrolase family protein n=1 Tax=Metabacillus mangrovi TaxID=1491830 RepID=A0A7X2S4V8_9BACI|nr:ADP-ribosylglycohydrolase family protein [Metabacillus mangrovi]MTH53694.1 ADP-ribosylglycohydrolase family protein [Metabacillus mangrovi]
MQEEEYLEKVYAGFLGMNIGIRLGAPVEPKEWTYERIRDVYGEIHGYIKDYRMFSADDDANGPVFFIRALSDDARGRELQPQDVGRAWLNYCREGIGMLWWGGEENSTEHRAYANLANGIPAPDSGSAERNGMTLAEQIGGQIFIDTWGLLFPGEPSKAADYAEMAASVSHDRNGLYGARFIAACIAQAFEAGSINEIVSAGLLEIPADCEYAKLVCSVLSFHKHHPEDFRLCYHFVEEQWGYHRYPGDCHIIPNAGICVLALLYGNGSIDRTVEIAVMCGWDTDCNAGNVGTIAGVFAGLAGIPRHYRKPVNDTIVTSSVSGFLNIVDIPSFVKELAGLRLEREGKPPLPVPRGDIRFDFSLPGSTHGFLTDNPFKTIVKAAPAALEVLFDRMTAGERSRIFWKSFYRRADFNDEKYKPVFSPKAYSGQTVRARIFLDQWRGERILLTPYVRDTFSKEAIKLAPVAIENQAGSIAEFTIPDLNGSFADEIGFELTSHSPSYNRAFGRLLIKEFQIFGPSAYSIDFRKQAAEFQSVTPFSHHKGKWRLQEDCLLSESAGEASSYTGNYYERDYTFSAEVTPLEGESHLLLFRGQGTQRHYMAGFNGEGKVSIFIRDFGLRHLQTAKYEWQHHTAYEFKAVCIGEEIAFSINGEKVLTAADPAFTHGMYGFASLSGGKTKYREVRFQSGAPAD